MSLCTIGVDVGGTNIKLGLVTSSGRIIAKTNLITKSYIHHPHHLIDALVAAIRILIKDNSKRIEDIAGIGIGLPGLVDVVRGVVVFLPNIPGWRDVPLCVMMRQKLNIPVFLDNDVNLITLGEWRLGIGKGYANLVCITLGTGVGGGLVLNNALYRGEAFVAGEIGHLPLNERGPRCNCGGYGCFERAVGNHFLQKKAAGLFRKKHIRLEDVYVLARGGNRRAIQFWDEIGTHIGNALVGVVNLLNPRLIIIGGGVASNYRFMVQAIRRTIKVRAMKVQKEMVAIVQAKLGADAGILGAHILVKEAILGR